jgi:hypothetical protein
MSSKNVRLFGPQALTTSAATKYTTPAGTVAVVQHIHVINPSGVSVNFTLSIGTDAAGTRIYDAAVIPAGGQIDTFAKYVLNAGDTIQAFATSTVAVLTIDGQELTAG